MINLQKNLGLILEKLTVFMQMSSDVRIFFSRFDRFFY